MTVLIVDDQIHVVCGLVYGIRWKNLGITRILKAYNAYEAKEQLKRMEVDIVLCDIEMPIISGLELCEYCKEAGYSAKFIFLTAHADFMYAQEAIKLGGFDYVLQPASYEKIEEVILRAKEQVIQSRKAVQIEKNRHLFLKQRDLLIENTCKEWCFNKDAEWGNIKSQLNDLGIVIMEEKPAWVGLIHFFEKSQSLIDWEEQLILYAISNILQELLHYYGYQCICWIVGEGDYVVYIYGQMDGCMQQESLRNQLEKFRKIFFDYYEQKFSCHIKACDYPQNLSEEYDFLSKMSRNNVGLQKEIFWEDGKIKDRPWQISFSDLGEEWEKLLKNKLYESFIQNVKEQIQKIYKNNMANAEVLNRFYQEFMRVIYIHMNYLDIKIKELFPDANDLENACSAYKTIEKMEWLIEYISTYFGEIEEDSIYKKTQIDSILQYIRSHLDQEIRRSEIADAVHLNPNYVSRLFKSIEGISLKEYILQEKMKLAAHFVRETNLPISVIAMKVGYTNFSLFTQTYKKMNGGMTPVEERKQLEAGEK